MTTHVLPLSASTPSSSSSVPAIAAPAYGPLALRLGLGIVFLAHAYAKYALFTLPGTAAFFEAHGFPGWTAYPVFAAELVGGLALLAGYRTRIVAIGLIGVLLGALKVHLPNGWSFTAPGGGWEYVAFLIVSLTGLALTGPGAHALQRRRA